MEQFDNEFFGFGVETNEDTNDFNYDSISGLGESDYENEDLFSPDVNDNNEDLSSKSLAKILFKEIANSLCENYLDTYYQVDSKMKPFTLYNSLNNKKSRVYYY